MKNTAKTAYEKVKSGVLLVNGPEVDSAISQSVNFLPSASFTIESCEDNALNSIDKFKAPTRLSPKFARKVAHRHKDDEFVDAILLALLAQPAAPEPTVYACC